MTEIRSLTPRECLALLCTQRVGRLAYTEQALPMIRPVAFFPHDGDLILHTAGTGRPVEEVVAFEVDNIDRTQAGWSVVVVGRTRRLTELEQAALAGDRLGTLLRLSVELISGRVLRLSDPDPASDAAVS